VAQVLLTLPYSFSQLGMLSGILFQLFYGLLGSWTAYLISILYVEYRTRKEREKVDFRNHVIQVNKNYIVQIHFAAVRSSLLCMFCKFRP
jgi:SNF family Na+-dependent transporter